MRPKVSVIMPVLNGERFIGIALESIASQTYPNCELVVVDDGSTDRTMTVVDGFRDRLAIRCVRHDSPKGIPVSMNDGVRHATGDFISFLDHDDTWLPEFAATQIAHLETHPDVGMVHSDFGTIDLDGNVIEASVAALRDRPRPSGNVFPQLFMDSFIVGNSVMIRRECFTQVGMFDESLRWGDYHLWMRIARRYRVDYTDRVLTQYRQHPTQSTRSSANARPDAPPVALQAIEKVLEEFPEVRRELGARTINHRIASFYFDLAYGWYTKDEFANARVCLRRALTLWPGNRRYLTLFAGTLLPAEFAHTLRQVWRRLRGQQPRQVNGVRGITG